MPSTTMVNLGGLLATTLLAIAPAPVLGANKTEVDISSYSHVREWAPGYSGFNKIWEEAWWGDAGQLVDESVWEIKTDINVNNEWQQYTRSNQNIQISGGGTLQIVPRKDPSTGQWTSGRVESWYNFSPPDGKVTFAEAKIRFGENQPANTQGIWPAFWMLGYSIRQGTAWPASGEIDIMERVNGLYTGYGTIHCDVYPGGACNEPSGLSNSVPIPDNGWHTWRIQFDRTPGAFYDESLTWYLDGAPFHSVYGWQINNEAVWNTLVASPVYFILNVAVGGNWPGPPNDATLDGFGSMMEVSYVSHYESV